MILFLNSLSLSLCVCVCVMLTTQTIPRCEKTTKCENYSLSGIIVRAQPNVGNIKFRGLSLKRVDGRVPSDVGRWL